MVGPSGLYGLHIGPKGVKLVMAFHCNELNIFYGILNLSCMYILLLCQKSIRSELALNNFQKVVSIIFRRMMIPHKRRQNQIRG